MADVPRCYLFRVVDADDKVALREEAFGDLPGKVAELEAHGQRLIDVHLVETTRRRRRPLLTGRHLLPQSLDGKWLKLLALPRRDLRARVREGVLRGQVRLFGVSVDTTSLVEFMVRETRRLVLEGIQAVPPNWQPEATAPPPGREEEERQARMAVAFRELPVVPPEDLVLSPIAEDAARLCRALKVVPVGLNEEGELRMMMLDQHEDYHDALSDFGLIFGNVTMCPVRCGETFDEHRARALPLFEQLEARHPDAIVDGVENCFTLWSADELPTRVLSRPIDALRASRTGVLLREAGDLVSRQAGRLSPIKRLAQLLVVDGLRRRACGFRLAVGETGDVLYDWPDGSSAEVDRPPLYLWEDIHVCTSAIGGIPPWEYEAEREEMVIMGGLPFTLNTRTWLSDWGPCLEMRWERCQ